MNIAERLKDLRKEAGYSQEQVAELLNVSRQAVSKWESAQGYPDIENIVKLAQMYEISTDYLLLGKEPPARNAAEADISETVIPQSESQNKREMSPETKKTLRIIAIIVAIIGASALFTVFLIAALSVVERFLELTIRL
ncbi:XRE family transcriptional regulator [bacterium 1XD8-76]|nr:XRE family transcriptional regulator [bacterium 1XD8-76]